MKPKFAVLFLILLLSTITAACGALSGLGDSRVDAPPTPLPTATATAAPITEDPAGYARAFYRAWEMGDYLGMYSLLSPSSQTRVESTIGVFRKI